MNSLVRPELPTAALRSSQATHAALDNSAPSAICPESTYKSGKVVQTNGTTSGVQYEVGLINGVAVPHLSADDIAELSRLGRRSWSLRRLLDTCTETSHAFILPAGLNEKVTGRDRTSIERELDALKTQIDQAAFALYGISPEDCGEIETTAIEIDLNAEAEDATEEVIEEDDPSGAGDGGVSSWLVGAAFGRFDPRLATGERAIPPEPEPFDPLPSRSPGMYPDGEEPADRPDILVDDEGHADDLAARAIAVAERVKVDAPENLRGWLAKEFFPLHIKMYSKSRRKAPIYWQLATPSASYSVWLYIHAFSKDTLFRVQNDYVAPKLAHEERRLESLTSELRDGATAAQRKASRRAGSVRRGAARLPRRGEARRAALEAEPRRRRHHQLRAALAARPAEQVLAEGAEVHLGRALRGQVRLGPPRDAPLARARGPEVREGPQPRHRPRARGRVLGRGHATASGPRARRPHAASTSSCASAPRPP